MYQALNKRRVFKLVFAGLLALTFCMAHPTSTAYAKKRKPANYGSIQVRSVPEGLSLEIDGKSEGQTTSAYRSFDRAPGLHTIVVTFPNGKRWRREIDLVAGRIKCVDVTYRIHCWDYPLTASITKTSKDGDVIVAYRSDVTYDGPGLKYIWNVSPSAKIVRGGNGSPDIAIDTSELTEKLTVSLLVDADDGSGDPRCRAEAVAEIAARERCSSVSRVDVTASTPYYRSGDKVTFTAHPEHPANIRPTFKWTVTPSPATITFGQGTDTISVDTAGVPEDTTLTASVVVDDDDGLNDADCPPARGDLSLTCGADCGGVRNLNDLKARLDDFVTKLQTNPGSEGLIYIYGPRKKAETVSNQARTYLVTERGIDASRVNVKAVIGGERVHFEFFVVGRGETPMEPDNRRLQLEQPAGIQHVPGYPRHSPAKHRRRRR